MRFFIGVDIGTQGTKGALVSEGGEIRAACSIEHAVTMPHPGWAEHDAEQVWWEGFTTIVRQLLAEAAVPPAAIAGIGVSSLMPVMLPVDAALRPLRPAMLYADTRAHRELEALNLLQATRRGRPFVAHDIGPKVHWFRAHEPERWHQTDCILGAQGYVIAKLTGERVIDRTSALGLGQLIRADGAGWDALAGEALDLPVDRLPRLVEMTDIVGAVSPAAAALTGLRAGTPVTGGATDFVAEMVSTAADAPGDAVISYGTTVCVAAFSPAPAPAGPGNFLQLDPTLSRLYPERSALVAGMATSGALPRWFRDQFGSDAQPLTYGQLGHEATAIPPGADGLVVLPYFSGERSPLFDDQARGVIFGLTLAHGRAHLYRALLEGVAYSVEHNFDLMRQAGVTPRRLVATGGGSRSPLWTQIMSDVTGLPQVVIAPSNAALGAAFLAGFATGDFTHLRDIRRWARPEREVIPDLATHARYQTLYEVYRRLYVQTKEEMHAVAQFTAAAARGREAALSSCLSAG